VAGERWQQGWWQQKANNNQPATGLTKAGGGWRESVDEATTRPRRWATTNDKSVRLMKMAATKRARVDRAMVMEMSVVGDEEGEGNDEKDGVGNEGGVQQRGRWGRLQERWQRVWLASYGDEGDGDGDGDGEGDDMGDGLFWSTSNGVQSDGKLMKWCLLKNDFHLSAIIINSPLL
jgi:hypothetical protein